MPHVVTVLLAAVAAFVVATLPTPSLAAVHGFRIQYETNPHVLGVVLYIAEDECCDRPHSFAPGDIASAAQYPETPAGWIVFGEPVTGKDCTVRDSTDPGEQWWMWNGAWSDGGCTNWGDSHGLYNPNFPIAAGHVREDVYLVQSGTVGNGVSGFEVLTVDENGNDIEVCLTKDVNDKVTLTATTHMYIFDLLGCDYTAVAPDPVPSDYDYSSCATGTYGIDCSCTADSTTGTDAALATSLTFSHATNLLTVAASGALDQTQRAVTDVSLGNSAGDTCYQVPYASWSCDATTCACTATVAITDYIAACSPTETSLDDDRVGFTVYATTAGQDTRDTDKFGQPIDPAEVTTLSATSSTTVTTQQTVIQAVGVDQGITSLTVDTIRIE